MNKRTTPTPSSPPLPPTSKTSPSSNARFLKEINHRRYIVALDTYLGFQELTSNIQDGATGGPYYFDFMIWPSWNYVKIFTVLDKKEIAKYANYPKRHKITFLIDADASNSPLTRIEKHGLNCCSLDPAAFKIALPLDAYLYFERRIWSSHRATNIWEPLLPIATRILHERDWNLIKPSPVTIHRMTPKLSPRGDT